jgi:hypothetical protein
MECGDTVSVRETAAIALKIKMENRQEYWLHTQHTNTQHIIVVNTCPKLSSSFGQPGQMTELGPQC